MTAPTTTTSMSDAPSPEQPAYPLPLPEDDHDPRFTFGLLLDVVEVLVSHGYPRPTTGPDLLELQQCLWRFAYGARRPRYRPL